jgi:uncharacterized caspase-like protein
MEVREALKVVRALADGVDPTTGEVLAEKSVYQNPQTVRALNRAVGALEYLEERERNKGKLPANAGKPWSRAEDGQLCEELQKGVDFHEIAKTHNRTVASIVAHLVKLGKIAANTSPPKVAGKALWT